MIDDIAIKVENLSKCYQIYDKPHQRLLQGFFGSKKQHYKEFWALKDISFEIKKGETVGIIGRNGSGKSTLLQIICGTLMPTGGRVETYGRIAALLELGSGFNPEFTGRENVYLNAAILGLTQQEIDSRYEAIEHFADIGAFIDQPVKIFSSGMVVRLAFATAIHVEPNILVVDEALAVGDTAFQQKCLSRIRKMQRAGVSILLVTHSSNTLIEYCDRGIFLKHGQLILDGCCREVVKTYADDLVQDEGGAINAPESTPEQALTITSEQIEITPANPTAANPVMEIVSVSLIDEHQKACSTVRYGSPVYVTVTVRLHEPSPDPCFGIQLSSPDGITLWSATTQSIGLALPAMEQGQYQFTWDLTANFAGNRYVVAIGVGQILNGEYKRHHRLDYAGHFDVVPIAHSGAGWLAPLPTFQAPTKQV